MNKKCLTYGIAALLAVAGALATTARSDAAPESAPTFTPENYTDAAQPMMPLIMKVTLPADKMKQLRAMMQAGANSCIIDDLEPDNVNSLVMICGLRSAREIFSNN